jgi:hypothetical protein
VIRWGASLLAKRDDAGRAAAYAATEGQAAANGKQPGSRQIVTNETHRMEAIGGLSTNAKAALKRMARHNRCSVAVLVQKWITATENRLAGKLKGRGSQAPLRGRIEECRH